MYPFTISTVQPNQQYQMPPSQDEKPTDMKPKDLEKGLPTGDQIKSTSHSVEPSALLTSTGPEDVEKGLAAADRAESGAARAKDSPLLRFAKRSLRDPKFYGKFLVAGVLSRGAIALVSTPKPHFSGGHEASTLAADGRLSELSLQNHGIALRPQAGEGLQASLSAYIKELVADANRPLGDLKQLTGEKSPSEVRMMAPLADGENQKPLLRLHFKA